jgi:hypothetical protein
MGREEEQSRSRWKVVEAFPGEQQGRSEEVMRVLEVSDGARQRHCVGPVGVTLL